MQWALPLGWLQRLPLVLDPVLAPVLLDPVLLLIEEQRGGRSSGGTSSRSIKPRWSGAGSSQLYTPEEVRALTPIRETVETWRPQPGWGVGDGRGRRADEARAPPAEGNR